jgi:hypothetical protein
VRQVAKGPEIAVLICGANPAFKSTDVSLVVSPHKMSREHLSFMEHPRHNDVIRIIDIESD